MTICKLCNKNQADKKNTHVIPHFLIESMVNVGGIKGRGRELSIGIGKGIVNEYFGDSVLPEKINDYLNRELTDEEIANQQHHFAVDYVFCSDCEKRFATFESLYSKAKPTITNELISNKIDSTLSFLFWASVVWRISITDCLEFKLKMKDEKKLRNILNKYLDEDLAKSKQKIRLKDEDISNFAYRLIRLPIETTDHAGMCYASPNLNMPYTLIINEYLLLLYISNKHIDQIKQTFYGFEKLSSVAPINILGLPTETISIANQEFWKTNMESFIKKRIDDFIKEMIIWLRVSYKEAFKSNCPPSIIESTIKRIIGENPDVLGGRYDKASMTNLFTQEIRKQLLEGVQQ